MPIRHAKIEQNGIKTRTISAQQGFSIGKACRAGRGELTFKSQLFREACPQRVIIINNQDWMRGSHEQQTSFFTCCAARCPRQRRYAPAQTMPPWPILAQATPHGSLIGIGKNQPAGGGLVKRPDSATFPLIE